MSDCSTNAFKVPDGMCSCNRSRGYDDLLERYQQLEQVAKSLWQFIEARNRYMEIAQGSYILGKTAEQLEALGVDV